MQTVYLEEEEEEKEDVIAGGKTARIGTLSSPFNY